MASHSTGKQPHDAHATHGHSTKPPTGDAGSAHGKPQAHDEALTLMVLMDGSPTAEYALETALDWARGHPRASVLLVHAIELVKFTAAFAGIGIEHAAFVDPSIFRNANDALVRRAKEMLNAYGRAAKSRSDANIKAFVLVSDVDSPKDAALRFANEHHVHTIFVGTRGLGAFQRWFLGSFSSAIVQHAKCDVCVVKVPPPGSHGFPELRGVHGLAQPKQQKPSHASEHAQQHPVHAQLQPKPSHATASHGASTQPTGSGGGVDPAYQNMPTEESLSDRLNRLHFK